VLRVPNQPLATGVGVQIVKFGLPKRLGFYCTGCRLAGRPTVGAVAGSETLAEREPTAVGAQIIEYDLPKRSGFDLH